MGEMAFSSLRILDCTQGVAGPYCAKWLADFGAEVIKVEKPEEGDVTRRWGPFPGDNPNSEKSGAFFFLNTNKKSITLNLLSERGMEIFKELLKGSAALIENFGPETASRIGLTYARLKEWNPNLIMTSISPYGHTGPYKDYKATNFTVYGLSGAMYTMRDEKKPMDRPVVEGGIQAEYSAGLLGYIATVAALMNREKSGEGRWIDISAMESIASSLTMHIDEYSYIGLSRRTNPWPIHGYPIGYSSPCKDGWISLTPGIGGAPNIALLMEKPELMDIPLLTKPAARMSEPEKFDDMVLPWLKEHGKWEVTKKAQELRMAFTPVLSPGDLRNDEQLEAREFFKKADHPVMGEVEYPGAPARLSESPWRAGRAPLLGEHNEEIYGNLGLGQEDLDRLHAEGIL